MATHLIGVLIETVQKFKKKLIAPDFDKRFRKM